MKTLPYSFAVVLLACFSFAGCCTPAPPFPADHETKPEASAEYPDPQRFENAIRKFEAADAESMPPKGAVVVAGSSSVRMWHGKLQEDLAPLTVIGRGFGGSNMNDLLTYLDRLVLKHEPRAVVIYEGDNDIAQGVSPAVVTKTFEQVLQKIEQAQPGCRVYILAVKPSLKRWDMWPTMQRLNARFIAIAEENPNVTYLDIATPMLTAAGEPDPALFVSDGLHLNREGYKLWRDTVRPVLVEAEKRYE
ncbi:MAG: GDSL-type esterase/lipase family protein [Phycisphaeraceae bacterium]